MNGRGLWLSTAIVGIAVFLFGRHILEPSLSVRAQSSLWQATTPTDGQSPSDATVFRAQTKLVLVDSVVTDKKGNYIRDLTIKNFRVWEDDKEQVVKTFSYEGDNPSPNNPGKHYLVLFFDNAAMNFSEQVRSRQAAAKFIDANAGPDRLIAAAEFSGALRITQDFTADAARLKKVVAGVNSPDATARSQTPAPSLSPLMTLPADFGVRSVFWALRNVAKGLATVPGRKSLVLLTAGYPLTQSEWVEVTPELTATIDACNRANVAIYPIDVRGLVDLAASPVSGVSRRAAATRSSPKFEAATFHPATSNAHLVFVQPSGGGSPTGGGPPGGHGPSPPGGGHNPPPPPSRGPSTGSNSLNTNPRPVIIPPFPPSITTNQEVLYALAEGTGGFMIHDTNDLLGGMERISREQSEYYLIGYTPPDSKEGSCHTIRVKVDRAGTTARSRSGYCNSKPIDLLAGKPIERVLENRAASGNSGTVSGSLKAPFFFTSPNVARVNVAMETPSGAIKFKREKGKFEADIDVLGIAKKPDGFEAARFSDNVHLEFTDKELEDFYKKPFVYENQFDVASGQYQLTVVFSSGGDGFGKLGAPLSVDYYDGSYFGLSSLALSKELHPVSQVSEKLDSDLMEGHAPLVYRGTEIVPAADYHFGRSEPVAAYFEIYEPLLTTPNPPKVGLAVKVMDNKTGTAALDLNITETEASIHAGNPVIPMALHIPVDKFVPGSYQLQLRALDSAGNVSVTRTANFVVEQ